MPPPYPPPSARTQRTSPPGGSILLIKLTHRRVKSLILWGPTRTGKTLFARSLGRHSYFNLQFNLDSFSESSDYAVFDDIQGGFEFFHAYKGWLGAQKEFVITDKYKRKKTIKWGKPCIMLMNDDPAGCAKADYEWLLGNCDIIHGLPHFVGLSKSHANMLLFLA